MRHPWIGRRRVEQGLVGLASLDGLLHGVVDLQDDALGTVLTVGGFVLALDDGEGIHNVALRPPDPIARHEAKEPREEDA